MNKETPMPQLPNTDSLPIALIAATLDLIKPTGPAAARAQRTIEERLQDFVDTYEVLSACVTKNPDEARARLKARQPG